MILTFGNMSDYKLINHRNVNKLIDAEFLHDLYNQAVLEINPVRFRNVVSYYKNGIFDAYAPKNEWNFLSEYVGNKFLTEDETFLSRLDIYIEKPKKELLTFISNFEKENLKNDSARSLVDSLIEIQYLALSEIYGINLVQIEEGLYYAIKKFIKSEKISFNEFDWLLGDAHSVLTNAIEFKKSLIEDQKNGKISLTDAKSKYISRYGSLGLAYGDVENSSNFLPNIYKMDGNIRVKSEKNIDENIDESEISLTNNTLARTLRKYSSKIFELRDKNKLLMGKVSKIKDEIYNKLLFKLNIDEEQGRYYLLSELYKATYDNYKVDNKTISARERGVTFNRQDNIKLIKKVNVESKKNDDQKIEIFNGVPVSQGLTIGTAHLVDTTKDGQELKNGEILVAPGTDFNLIDAFYKGAGFVTEEGGILSHASIVAREMGKPCIVGIKNLHKRVKDGDTLIINGNSGKVGNFRFMNIGLLGKFDDANTFGNKANRLSILKSKNYPVLPGIALSFDSSKYDLDLINESLYEVTDSLWANHKQIILRSSDKLEDGYKNSMAGHFISLNCKNSKKDFCLTLRDFEKNSHVQLFIQPYIHSSFGGVAFVEQKTRKVILEASENGAEDVVNGKVTKRYLGYLSSLRDSQAPYNHWINEISKYIDSILKEVSFDLDIEWCIDNKGNFKIFQLRPVTKGEIFNVIK